MFRSERANMMLILGSAALCGVLAIAAIVAVTARAVANNQRSPARRFASPDAERMPDDEADAAPPASPVLDVDLFASLIVYTCFTGSNDDICLMNADGSSQQRLTFDPATDFYPSLGPNNEQVVFSSRRTGQFEIYSMDTEGENVTQLTENLDSNYAPEISPNGDLIVFVSTISGKQDIYVMEIDGSNPTRVTTNPNHDIDPTWSPDGEWLAFSSNRTGSNELYIIRPDGTGEQQITSGSGQREGGRVDWSPDGEWLGFYAGVKGDKDLYLVPLNECLARIAPCGPDQIVRLTDGGNNKAPSFSPDSQWIAFASNLEGENNVFVMRIDGTELHQVTFENNAQWQPRWGP